MREMTKAALLVLAIGLAGLASAQPVPPITETPTGSWDPGQLVWADLLTDDVAKAKAFYGDVFGWQFAEGGDEEYVQATHDGKPIAGIAFHEPKDPKVREVVWLVSISVEDVDTAAAAAAQAGGKVLEEPRDVPDRGRFAIIQDGQGAVSALLKTSGGDPPMSRAVDNEWIWAELWTRDPKSAAKFYAATVGYRSGTIKETDGDYLVLVRDGKPKTGIVELPWEKVEPHWLPYLRVADLAATIDKIEEAGGELLVEPNNEQDAGRVAIVSDSTGGAFAIQVGRSES